MLHMLEHQMVVVLFLSVSEKSCTADTGNGCWITGMEAQAAETGGRKEAEKSS